MFRRRNCFGDGCIINEVGILIEIQIAWVNSAIAKADILRNGWCPFAYDGVAFCMVVLITSLSQ